MLQAAAEMPVEGLVAQLEREWVGQGDGVGGQSDEDGSPGPSECGGGLRPHVVGSDELGGDVESASPGEEQYLVEVGGVGRVEGGVRAEREGAVAGRAGDVQRDDRGGAGGSGELDRVCAQAAGPPDSDRLADPDAGGFVAGCHVGNRWGQYPSHQVDVTRADTAGLDADEDLPWAGSGNLDVFEGEGLRCCVVARSGHLIHGYPIQGWEAGCWCEGTL